ncbi:MAG: signal peptidase II [Ruminococcus sp.]|nr:signal peptidase II [Ruminococcus sp.]
MPFIILISAIAIAGIDQLFKFLVAEYLKPVGSVDVIPNLFSLTYVENKGAAFGIMSNMRWVFIVFTLIVIAVLIYIVIKNKIKSKLFIISAILLIGGGIGNLIDRIFYGYVIDYLSLSFFSPVCNFADYCITFGTVLLVIYLIFFSNFFKDNKKVKADE